MTNSTTSVKNHVEAIGGIDELNSDKNFDSINVALGSVESAIEAISKSMYKIKVEELAEKIRHKGTEHNRQMLAGIVLKYGSHIEDCSFYEEMETGRIGDKEECSCGWNNIKDQVTLNKDRA